jgi:hypothetical protein
LDTFRKENQIYLESFEIWCWRRMQKISWTDRVESEEVLYRVREARNIIHAVKRRKTNGTGNILCRNCLLKHVIEGKIKGEIEETGREGRRRKQLLDDLKGKRGKTKEEVQDRPLWRTLWIDGWMYE